MAIALNSFGAKNEVKGWDIHEPNSKNQLESAFQTCYSIDTGSFSFYDSSW